MVDYLTIDELWGEKKSETWGVQFSPFILHGEDLLNMFPYYTLKWILPFIVIKDEDLLQFEVWLSSSMQYS